jgi:hypothetical protein
MAYPSISRIANVPDGTKMLVVLAIGNPHSFIPAKPPNNLVTTRRWKKCGRPRTKAGWRGVRSCGKVVDGKLKSWHERLISVTTPYGGKGSPFMEYFNWQEAFVAVAAHEFNHIRQYQHDMPRSEIECEKAANAALLTFRAEGI